MKNLMTVAFLGMAAAVVVAQHSVPLSPDSASLKYVAGLAGKDVCASQLTRTQPLRTRLRTLMKTDITQLDTRWSMCETPVVSGFVVVVHNMRAHMGTEEEAFLAVDTATNAVAVKILHQGKIYTYSDPAHPVVWPAGWRGDFAWWKSAVEVPGQLGAGPRPH